MFSVDFIKCNIIFAFFILIVRIITVIFRKFFSPRSLYTLGLILLIIFLIPFVPISHFRTNNTIFSFHNSTDSSTQNKISSSENAKSGLLNDTSEFVTRFEWDIINSIFIIVWLFGVLFTIIRTIYTNIRIYLLKKYSLPCNNASIKKLLKHCLYDMTIKKNITIRVTSDIKTPCIVGIFNPCILFPKQTLSDIVINDIRYIFLHELQHFKQKDIWVNYLICIIRIIYWFNPIIHWLLQEIRQLQELTCDNSVLRRINSSNYHDYGNALINFAELISKQNFPALYNIGGSYASIKRRIVAITNYRNYNLIHKIKESLFILCIAVVFLCNMPSLHFLAAQNTILLDDLEYSTLDLSPDFASFDGSFVLYDTKNDTYLLYNIERCTTRSSPNSTYKIYSALAALEFSIITPINNSQRWLDEEHKNASWNQDHDLESAMSNSVNWYFQRLDQQVGRKNLVSFFNRLQYGNMNISGDISDYWLESTLQISPIEQVQLLSGLNKNIWNFKTENIEAIKKSIYISSSSKGKLFGKTGTGNVNGAFINGWFIGFIESAENTFVFATNIQGADNCDGKTASDISLNILSDLGIY